MKLLAGRALSPTWGSPLVIDTGVVERQTPLDLPTPQRLRSSLLLSLWDPPANPEKGAGGLYAGTEKAGGSMKTDGLVGRALAREGGPDPRNRDTEIGARLVDLRADGERRLDRALGSQRVTQRSRVEPGGLEVVALVVQRQQVEPRVIQGEAHRLDRSSSVELDIALRRKRDSPSVKLGEPSKQSVMIHDQNVIVDNRMGLLADHCHGGCLAASLERRVSDSLSVRGHVDDCVHNAHVDIGLLSEACY